MDSILTVLSRVFSVAALAKDLGTIKSTNDAPITWSVGYVRDPAIKYTTATKAIQQRRPYYVTQYTDIDDAVSVRCSFSAGLLCSN